MITVRTQKKRPAATSSTRGDATPAAARANKTAAMIRRTRINKGRAFLNSCYVRAVSGVSKIGDLGVTNNIGTPPHVES